MTVSPTARRHSVSGHSMESLAAGLEDGAAGAGGGGLKLGGKKKPTWQLGAGESLTAAIPMENPYCS